MLLAPVGAGGDAGDEPLGVQAGGLALAADQERRHPDPGPAAARADVGREPDGRSEVVARCQPVADLGLVALVQQHQVDAQVVLVELPHLVHHVPLGDLAPVRIPTAPRRPEHPYRGVAGIPRDKPVRPVRESAVGIGVGAGSDVDVAVGGDDEPVTAHLAPNRRHGVGRGCRDHGDFVAGGNGQQAFALETARFNTRPVGHDVVVGGGRAGRARGEGVPAAGAPGLPAVFEDQGGGVVPEFGDGTETHGILDSLGVQDLAAVWVI